MVAQQYRAVLLLPTPPQGTIQGKTFTTTKTIETKLSMAFFSLRFTVILQNAEITLTSHGCDSAQAQRPAVTSSHGGNLLGGWNYSCLSQNFYLLIPYSILLT